MKSKYTSLLVALCTLAFCAASAFALTTHPVRIGPVEHLEHALAARHPLEHLEFAKRELESGMHKHGNRAAAMVQINEAIEAARHHHHHTAKTHIEKAILALR